MKDNNDKVTKGSYEELVEFRISAKEVNRYKVFDGYQNGKLTTIYKVPKTKSMKNLKEELKDYLLKNGKSDDTSYRELYETFPFDGHNLSNKQKGDRVRSVWKRLKRQYPQGTQQANELPKMYVNDKRAEAYGVAKENVSLDNWKAQSFSQPYQQEELRKLNEKKCGKKTPHGIDYSCPFDAKLIEGLPSAIDVLDLKEVKTSSTQPIKGRDPKILIYDLETSPLKSYVWSLWKQNVNPTNGQLQSQKMILSWSAKWLYGDDVMHNFMRPNEIEKENDFRVTVNLWNLINEADIIIAHNANGFDVKIMNTRFLLHGLPPPSHYQIIDTLLHARKRFKLESNKLDYIAQVLGLGNKKETGGFKLWVDCMNGDKEAMKHMVEYCDEDVLLLEAVYLKLRPWIMPHPNLNLITDDIGTLKCPSCDSINIKTNGTYTTYANVYPAHQCNSCNSTFRSRKAIKFDKTNLTIPTPN